jgi:putative ATP-dependent endonuclease of OLD family
MRLTQLHVTNYQALRDVTIPLSRFGCLIGENNAGKSSFLQALSLFFSGTRLSSGHYFDESQPVRIAVTFEDIGEGDLARLAEEHRTRVAGIVKSGRLELVRIYDTDGKSALLYNALTPTEPRFSASSITELTKSQRAGPAFVSRVVMVFPELLGKIDQAMAQDGMKQAIQELADSFPPDQKSAADQALPTGIDKSIDAMLPDVIYIPAVKDLADDIKTAETTPFGKILAILLRAVEPRLSAEKSLFADLNAKLNRVTGPDGAVVDGRLEEVKLIESTVERYVCDGFAKVSLRISIPPPELKSVFSSARIEVDDGVIGPIDSKGDGLRRAIVFAILRSYVDLADKLAPGDGAVEVPLRQSTPGYLLLFEEPELFLHPKAQHVLFDALRVFSGDNHVMVTTHSPMFFGPRATETFVKLRRMSDPQLATKPFTQVQPVDLRDMGAKDQFQIICFENNNAAFFADTVVLVEGDSDYLLMPHIARTIDPSWDASRTPVVFARIMGKGNIRRYREFFSRFRVRVPVITDLDFLVDGFEKIDTDNSVKAARDQLMARVDQLIPPEANSEPSAKQAKDAHESGDLRGLWRRVRQRQAELQAGACTAQELDEAVAAFFAWEQKADRLAVLAKSEDQQMLQLKWRLLAMLRAVDVYVLERGAIEQYYPDGITGADKPARAQDFCAKITRRDAIMSCCGEQEFDCEGVRKTGNEFDLIFTGIFGGSGQLITNGRASGR